MPAKNHPRVKSGDFDCRQIIEGAFNHCAHPVCNGCQESRSTYTFSLQKCVSRVLKESLKNIPWNRPSQGIWRNPTDEKSQILENSFLRKNHLGFIQGNLSNFCLSQSFVARWSCYFGALNRELFLQNCTEQSFEGKIIRHSFRLSQSLKMKEFGQLGSSQTERSCRLYRALSTVRTPRQTRGFS